MVDTGFTSFLLLPILSAFPIGLVLHSTMPITLADGSTQVKLTCLGCIHCDGQDQIGVVIIEWQNTDVLVGMEFLKKFGKQPSLIRSTITLNSQPRHNKRNSHLRPQLRFHPNRNKMAPQIQSDVVVRRLSP